MLLAIDTETTGLDPWHGSMPFLVTTYNSNDEQITWEWDVEPYTRRPQVSISDLKEIQDLIHEADSIVLQNSTFDLKQLETFNRLKGWQWDEWPWEKINDTQFTAHMIASCEAKDLTTLALRYLNIDVTPYEKKIEEATKKARRIAQSKVFRETYGDWDLARSGHPSMPSAGDRVWKADMWVPKALIEHAPETLPDWEGWSGPKLKRGEVIQPGDPPESHPWNDLVREYADSDSETTLHIFNKHREIIESRGQWPIYEERRRLLKIVYEMKETGVTINRDRRTELYREYEEEAERLRKKAVRIANNPVLDDLPVNGRSNALNEVVFDQFKLSSPFKTPTGGPSMNKAAIGYWLDELEPSDKRRLFLSCLMDYRQRKTAISYMDGYERFWIPLEGPFYVLHPSLHATGTNTLRWSSSNPNEQNISKRKGFNLRYCFGPRPGRLWASLDYENIELRIPAYESGEEELIALFEKPDDPPYYGSVHLLNFSTVFPDKWAEAVDKAGMVGASKWIKANWKDSWYQRCKNGDFAVQYGSVERGGGRWSTADRAFGRKGCQSLLRERFSKQDALNQKWINIANETGYVETMPDLEVCPEQGYPIQCSVNEWGVISPTVPLNYHVQGTACWVIFRAMVKVQEYFDEINEGKPDELKWYMVMQIHDELLLDFPNKRGYQYHLRKVKDIMESCGGYIGVPLKVGCDIHKTNWSESVGLDES